MIKLSDFGLLDDPVPAKKRHYQAAKHTRQNRGWTDAPMNANWILRCDLATLRARARDMVKNSPVFRKFILMAKANIVGHKGIQLQCDAVFASSGRPHTTLNSRIETAFWQWGKRENCTLTGKMNWVQLQQLCVEMVIRDGEVFVEHVMAADNPFGYAVRVWNADWIDEKHNEVLRNGNRIIMGIEVDRNDKPVGYWLTEPPSANEFTARNPSGNRYRRRVPAGDMTHVFLVTEDETQLRGVTWFHAALLQGKDLHEYATGVVQSARVAAHTFGFLKQTAAEEVSWDGSEDCGQCRRADCLNCNPPPMTIDKKPLSINILDPGFEFQQFNPNQPTQNHAEFMDSMLHVLAAAVGVPGFSLAGDMSAVNYSSARVGLNEEREGVWRSLQEFICDTLCRSIFQRWLTEAWLAGRVEIPAEYFKQLMEPTWRPRGWDYIDPQKDVTAAIDAIGNNLMTYKEHFAKRGIDLEDWLADKKAEKELFAEYGIAYGTAEMLKPSASSTTKPGDPPPAEDEERGYPNGHGLKVIG